MPAAIFTPTGTTMLIMDAATLASQCLLHPWLQPSSLESCTFCIYNTRPYSPALSRGKKFIKAGLLPLRCALCNQEGLPSTYRIQILQAGYIKVECFA